MTHEQKPESAEFRTLETQVSECARDLHASLIALEEKLYVEFAEAEARGAAEQRRKDEPEFEKIVAERDDAEDFIRKMAEAVLGEVVDWSNVYGFQNALNDVSERIFFLEKDTANVAALEARVKELEGEVERLKKPEFYSVEDQETGWFDLESLMESIDGFIPNFEPVEINCFRSVPNIWAFHDGSKVHEFATEDEARAASAIAIREGEQL